MKTTITLPWPPRQLSPNARHAHWSTLARAKRRYRSTCAVLAHFQGARTIDAPELSVSLTFCPPDRRARDMDNCIASLKSGLDGLADILGVDDSRWTLVVSMGEPTTGGAVLVEVSAL